MFQSISKTFSSLLQQNHLGELIRGGATTFYLRFIGYAIGLILIVFISRLYGAKVLGEYSLAITVLTLGSLLSRLGFDSSIVKLFAQKAKQEDWGAIKKIYSKIFKLNFISGLLLSILLFCFSDLLAINVFGKPLFALHIKIISILVIPLSLRLINAESYRGFKNMTGFAYSKHISYFLYALIILVGLTLYSKNNLNPILSFAAGLIILSITSSFILFKKINSHTIRDSKNSINNIELLQLSIPMLLSSASLILAGHLTKFLLGIYVTEVKLGIFNAALSAAMVQGFILAATNSIAAPKFAEAHYQKK